MSKGHWLKLFIDTLSTVTTDICISESQRNLFAFSLVKTRYNDKAKLYQISLCCNNYYYNTPWRSSCDRGDLDAIALIGAIVEEQCLIKKKHDVILNDNIVAIHLKSGLVMHIAVDD